MPSSETLTACASKVGPSAPPTSTNASKALRVAPGALRSSVLISSSVVSASAIENRSQEGQVFMAAHLIVDIETIPDPELPRQDERDRVPAVLSCRSLVWRAPSRRAAHRGIFECFLGGLLSRLSLRS